MQVLQTKTENLSLPETLPAFRVGGIPVYGDAILAPMDGFSDWPFRSICRGLGSAMSYNEFTRAEFILHGFEHILERFKLTMKPSARSSSRSMGTTPS